MDFRMRRGPEESSSSEGGSFGGAKLVVGAAVG